MIKTAATSSIRSRESARGRSAGLRFLLPLMLVGAAALAIRIYVGSKEYMDFDEWQQVFMADAPRWRDLAFELRREAHPPVFYALLRFLLGVGHHRLLYRLISIVPGTGSVLLMGWIGRKVFRSSTLAWLCAAALAFSAAAITISIEVRQYQLAVFLVLLALHSYLVEMLRGGEAIRTRHYVIFSAASALALGSQYSSVVFLGACILVPLALAAVFPDFRPLLASCASGRRRRLLAWSLGVPAGLFAFFYISHARRQPIMGYLYDFYWGWGQNANDTLPAFLLRNAENFWNLFSPVPLHNRAAFLFGFALVCAGSAYILMRTWSMERRWPSVILVAFAAVMGLELAGLGVMQSYPFGGLLRHQYVAGPFLILAVFALLDRLVSAAGPKLRMALLTGTGVLVLVNLAVAWPHLMRYPDEVVNGEEFSGYHALFPHPQGVYVDHWGVIGYYIFTNDRKRRFVRRIADGARIEQYHMEGPGGGVEIFYDKDREALDVSDPGIYRSLAACLRQSGIHELTLYYFTPGALALPEPPDLLKQKIEGEASAHGMSVTKMAVGQNTVYAGFVLR